MTPRSKGEQRAYLDGYEMCAECVEEYLSAEGKQKLECLLVAVRNAVEIEDIEPTGKRGGGMTREDAIDVIKCLAWHRRPNEEDIEQAIKALKQEPCDDCISREAVRQLICKNNDKYGYSDRFHEFTEECLSLPPVTPQQKTGHWITWKEAGNIIPSETRFECSACHDAAQTLCNGLDLLSSYCPNCGAKMTYVPDINDGKMSESEE